MDTTSELNPAVVKTELDGVFFQNYNTAVGIGMTTVFDPAVFKQVQLTNGAHIEQTGSGGGGLWKETAELESIKKSTPVTGNKQTFIPVKFTNSLKISAEFFRDNMHSTYERMVRQFGRNARATQETTGFGIYRGAFTTTKVASGASLISASHSTLTGGTVSNLVTGALSNTTLDNARVALVQQKSEEGIIMNMQASVFLVPTNLYTKACQIVDSELITGATEDGSITDVNSKNMYSSKYGIFVKQTPYLGTAAGGSDTAWFLLASDHTVSRYAREGVSTVLIGAEYSDDDSYAYKGKFRETYGASSYTGVVGSTGL